MQRAATSCWLALAQLKPSLTLQPLSCAAVRPISTSLAQAMPSRDYPAGRHLMQTHPFLPDDKPPLGSWPNFEPGVNKPNQCSAPEPSQEVLETKHEMRGDANDATEIEEYDRVHVFSNKPDRQGGMTSGLSGL